MNRKKDPRKKEMPEQKSIIREDIEQPYERFYFNEDIEHTDEEGIEPFIDGFPYR
jgi:hypothetical protein